MIREVVPPGHSILTLAISEVDEERVFSMNRNIVGQHRTNSGVLPIQAHISLRRAESQILKSRDPEAAHAQDELASSDSKEKV